MSKGRSLHIGLNRIDPDYYGTDGALAGCINDANDMRAIADAHGYDSTLLIDEEATKSAVVSAIGASALELETGDIFLLTYSGHGSQVTDVDSDESDGLDETWCLYDEMLIDDELRQMWSQFGAGVRIFMLSDSCHSGTMTRVLEMRQLAQIDTRTREFCSREAPAGVPQFRLLSPNVRSLVAQEHSSDLAASQWLAGGGRAQIGATVLFISGCQDNQLSLDGASNGLFTQTLKSVWNNGAFTGGYRAFHQAIASLMPATQSPNFDVVGAPNAAFEAQKPFAIVGAASAATSARPTTRPVIVAPTALVRGGSPPKFTIDPGAKKAYGIQFSTRPELLYTKDGRVWNSNYFSTLGARPLAQSSSYPIEYAMPAEAWAGLSQNAERLYYRLWASDRRDELTNLRSSAPNQATAPFVPIEAASKALPDTRSASEPWISAPPAVPNLATPPRFAIYTGGAPYFAVEVAISPELFLGAVNGEKRTAENFFASYEGEPELLAADDGVQGYDLPREVWERFRAGQKALYYRLQTSSNRIAFEDRKSTTPDRLYDESPSLRIEASAERARKRQAAMDGPGTRSCSP